MNKVRNFFIGLGIAVLCVVLWMVISVATKSPKPAIDITLTSVSGTQFKLSDNYGKRGSVLIFIDPEVEGSNLVLDTIIEKKGDADIIAVSVSDIDTNTQLSHLTENARALEKLVLSGKSATETYNIGNAPVTYFIDKEGLVQNAFIGNIKPETVEEYISIITEAE